jgi:hypothetical protein
MKTTFYLLNNADKRGEVRVRALSGYDEWALTSGSTYQSSALPVCIDKGKKFYDILRLQDSSNFSLSDRLHDLLISAGITGWQSYPLAIEGGDEKYWGIQIIGRAGPPFRPHEGFVEGLDFDRSTWDGSDMFLLEGTLFTIFSERLRNLLVKHKSSNLDLEEISAIRWYNSRPTSPVP